MSEVFFKKCSFKKFPAMSKEILLTIKEQMNEAIKALSKRFSGLRTGRASPALLEPLMVEAYGGRTPLSQLGTVNAPEARVLSVHVWDASVVSAVDKAIQASGLMPMIEGSVLRVVLPDLSYERRQELAKMAKTYAEESRVGVRQIRRSALDSVSKEDVTEDDMHRLQKEVQKVTDDYISEIDRLFVEKEKEILKV